MAKIDKLIVTNLGALGAKYGSTGRTTILRAVRRLIVADQARGVATALIGLDDARRLHAYGARAVTSPTDPRSNKAAIDALFHAVGPDYLMILGAIDVVPHQNLRNPVYDPNDDPDRFAYGDLPYACEAPYSQSIGDFRGPTRVVGRLPDVTGGTDPRYLTGLLGRAARWRQRARADYEAYLGITASVWSKSTALSLTNIFGNATDLQSVPPAPAPNWPPRLLGRRSHFINCHGADGEPFYYGQRGQSYPTAHAAAWIDRRVTEGTVIAAECCYGAELYDPQKAATAKGQTSICNTYLGSGAYGMFGSSTIAYGPSSGNGSADLICQYFLELVLEGASLGRAALEARQWFAQSTTVLDPTDLKTLGQFSLMGDPSIHPVVKEQPALTRGKVYRRVFPTAAEMPTGRSLRRERLLKTGLAIAASVSTARPAPGRRTAGTVKKVLEAAGRESGLRKLTWGSFSIHDPGRRLLGKAKARVSQPTAIHVAKGRPVRGPRCQYPVVLVATVDRGTIVRLRRLHGK